MKIKVNDIIKFDNGVYLVNDVIRYKNNTYAYLINNDKFINDTSIVKVIENDNTLEFKYIDNTDEFNYVLCKLYLNFKNDVLSFFE